MFIKENEKSIYEDYNDYYFNEIHHENFNIQSSKAWYEVLWQKLTSFYYLFEQTPFIIKLVIYSILINFAYTFLTKKFPQLKGSIFLKCKYLSMKYINDKYDQLKHAGKYLIIDKQEPLSEPIIMEYEPNNQELELIKKIRYKLIFEQEQKQQQKKR